VGKIVVTEFVSIDGVFEAPGGGEAYEHAGWTFAFDRGEDGNRFKWEELQAADAQLLGRVTYEGFARAWPTMTDEGGFADKMNAMPKYVVSTSLSDASWNNATIIRDDVPKAVTELKRTVTVTSWWPERNARQLPPQRLAGRRASPDGVPRHPRQRTPPPPTTSPGPPFSLSDLRRLGAAGVTVQAFVPIVS